MNLNLPPAAAEVLRNAFGVSDPAELPYETRKKLLQQITRPLWLKGDLTFLLDETQLKIRAAIEASDEPTFMVMCSRRLGKSFMLLADAVGLCMREPHMRVLFLAPTKANAREIATDLMGAVLEWAPDDLKPTYHAQTSEYSFSNGSLLRLRGVNGETADNLRGGSANRVIADECGFMDEFENVIYRVASPMTMATSNGRILLSTTPPPDPSHPSVNTYRKLASKGAAIRFTLLDANEYRIPRARKARYLEEAGEDPARIPDILDGKAEPETTTALREYFARPVTDTSRAIFPEYIKHRQEITRDYVLPAFTDRYVALDPGFVDNSGILYAHTDFFQSQLVIRREALLRKASTTDIAREVKRSEEELWAGYTPYRRISDIDLRLIGDLRSLHGLNFHKAQKQDLVGGVNLVRALIRSNQIVIDRGCTNLLNQLEMGVWTKKGTEFQNSGEGSELGHLDLVAALVYLVRGWYAERHHNPYPPTWRDVGHPGGPPAGSWISAKSRPSSDPRTNLLAAKTPLARNLLAARKKSAAR